jgi:hypothetical protein
MNLGRKVKNSQSNNTKIAFIEEKLIRRGKEKEKESLSMILEGSMKEPGTPTNVEAEAMSFSAMAIPIRENTSTVKRMVKEPTSGEMARYTTASGTMVRSLATVYGRASMATATSGSGRTARQRATVSTSG